MKTCRKCKESKTLDSYRKGRSECKACRNVYLRKYREANCDKIATRKRKYRKANREKARKYREANREKLRAQGKKYYQANRDKAKKYYQANREKARKYREANREKVKAAQKKYYQANRDKCKKYREANLEKVKAAQKEYKAANRDKINARYRKRLKTDPTFATSSRLRCRISQWLKGSKSTFTENLIGCTFEECKRWIERQFTDDMSWDNRGKWHIDHMMPLKSFDITDPEQQQIACHYTNLKPMWASENKSKGSNIVYDMVWKGHWYIKRDGSYISRLKLH
jgi:hypothetical protein